MIPNEKQAFETLSIDFPGIQKNGFSKFIKKHDLELRGERLPIVPDAWRTDGSILQIFEIEKTSRMTESKLLKIKRFFLDVYDCSDFSILELQLWVVNAWGKGATMILSTSDLVV